ncbi:MAG TPA: GNAT family N-acetyltransferase [Burkholderiales bacterium]|jgi:hypothetical protein|nr:GNAT family N-acetyltransferase [Burkholderiales bacterium]
MNFRRARDDDWPAVIALQDANLAWKLEEEDKRDGYLSAQFSPEQFGEMNAGGAVAVAEANGVLTGYACCAPRSFGADIPTLQAMRQQFQKLSYLGKPLDNATCCIYGPVCVARAFRGKGILRGLIGQLKEEIRGRFEVAACFIGKSNTRSFSAHVDGLGMSLVGDFRFEGRAYWIVAFGVPPAATSCIFR